MPVERSPLLNRSLSVAAVESEAPCPLAPGRRMHAHRVLLLHATRSFIASFIRRLCSRLNAALAGTWICCASISSTAVRSELDSDVGLIAL